METKKIVKTSWIERVMAHLNMNEKGQCDLFGCYALKQYKEAIKQRKTKILRLTEEHDDDVERDQELLAEIKEDLEQAAISVDPKKLGSREARENYFKEFDGNVSTLMAKVEAKEELIKAKQETYDKSIATLKKEIDIFQRKCNFLQ